MKSLRNKVQLIGRLGKDPEMRTFGSGIRQAIFSLATTDTYRNQKGEKVNDTQWHIIVVWGKMAEIVCKYLKKGAEIAIEGRLVHREYETANGEKRHVTEISASDLVMLSPRSVN
jgi:single-strand DNA-binding protein